MTLTFAHKHNVLTNLKLNSSYVLLLKWDWKKNTINTYAFSSTKLVYYIYGWPPSAQP